MAPRLKDVIEDLKENKHALKIRAILPPLNFITIHYAYFITTCLIFSVIFWGSSNPERSVSYADSLFLIISAMTEAGLNTVNLSTITTFQQILLWILILIGSTIFVSISTVHTRKRVFERRLKSVVKMQKEAKRMRKRSAFRVTTKDIQFDQPFKRGRSSEAQIQSKIVRNSCTEPRIQSPIGITDTVGHATRSRKASAENGEENEVDIESTQNDSNKSKVSPGLDDNETQDQTSMHDTDANDTSSPTLSARRVLTFVAVSSSPKVLNAGGIYNRTANMAESKNKLQRSSNSDEQQQWQYPDYLTRHTTGRNGQIFNLSKAEREHLGGVEYRAITMLSWVVPAYFTLWQLIGCLALGAYMAYNKADIALQNGINPWWLGIFNGVSAFNNSGMSLLDLNMIPFQTSVYPLFTMGMLILAGNTAYPLFLRLIFWSALKLLTLIYPSDEQLTDHKATLRFILQYPRRVYTNLFPSALTWWLLLMLITLNGIDWVAFELLNIGNKATADIPTGYRILDGLFQALAVRSGGFYVIAIPSLRIGLQILYVIMMYISVYPVVITMRHSNIYEERSLGIYADEEGSDEESMPPKLSQLAGRLRRTITSTFSYPFPSTAPAETRNTGTQFVRQQIRGQLAHDLWWLAGAVLLISFIEVSNFERDPVTYSVFNIIFEVVSGYGCVGISTGLPNEAYSFSGGWHLSSKLILCGVMLRGRHRGLPVALDRAVRLPGSEPGAMEEEDQMVRRRSISMTRTPFSARSPTDTPGGRTPISRLKSPFTGGLDGRHLDAAGLTLKRS